MLMKMRKMKKTVSPSPMVGRFERNFLGNGYNGETNANGSWVIQGKTCGNELKIEITKDGYHDSNRKMSFATMGAEHEVKDGKWQPWGKEELIVLRKIKNPIKMVHLSFFRGDSDERIVSASVFVSSASSFFAVVPPLTASRNADSLSFGMRIVWLRPLAQY